VSETSVVNAPLQAWLEGLGAYVFKTIATTKAGVVDVVFCLDGHYGSIEGKLDAEGTVSYLQWQNIVATREAGGFATVAYGLEDAKAQVLAWQVAGYDCRIGVKVKELVKRTL